MKKKILLMVLAFVAIISACLAADWTPRQIGNTETLTNSTSLYSTNYSVTFGTNYIEFANYHTFQIVVTSSNNISIALDRTLDGSTWSVVSTNDFIDPGGSAERQWQGKWRWMRARAYGTNFTTAINYLGGR